MKVLRCMKALLVFCALSVICVSAEAEPIVVMQTNYGDIVIELNDVNAPITTANFLAYVDSGFYDGLLFHRVMPDFMIQGGGFDVEGQYRQPLYDPIENESYNGLSNLRGTIAMARTNEPDSATSQFFINLVYNYFLDKQYASDGVGYAVFGNVVSGMDVVDAIAAVNTWPGDDPIDPVIIKSARRGCYVSPAGSDVSGTGSPVSPFATVQHAIDVSADDTDIILLAGTYSGPGNRDIDFKGKAVTVRGQRPMDMSVVQATIIDAGGSGHRGFYFHSGEDGNSVLEGLTIQYGYVDSQAGGGILCAGSSSPTIRWNVIKNNEAGQGAGIAVLSGSGPTITNNVMTANIADNGGGIMLASGTDAIIRNNVIFGNSCSGSGGGIYCAADTIISCCIVFGNSGSAGQQIYCPADNAEVVYNNIQGGFEGLGNIDIDPLFADPVNGDYHLRSEGWRYDQGAEQWIFDTVTSRCIDAGPPAGLGASEPGVLDVDPTNRFGVNVRPNMGLYGGSEQASMAGPGFAFLMDVNNDGFVSFADFAVLAQDWQNGQAMQFIDLNGDGNIDMFEMSRLYDQWLSTAAWVE